LVIGMAAAAACPPGAMLKTDWAWGSTGWVAVLVLLRRPMGELCGCGRHSGGRCRRRSGR